MRSGFVAVSFVSHALVVVLAARQPTNGLQTQVSPPVEPRPSGLWAVDLTSPTPAAGAESEPPDVAAEPPVTPAIPEVAAEPPAPPASPARPPGDSRATQGSAVAPNPAKRPAPAPEQRAVEEEEASSDADDWMSIEQQLPNAPVASNPPDKQDTQSAPASDALVERLLAKERDRQHVLQREERQRQAAGARNADPGAARLPTPGAEQEQAPAPVAGQSHAEADLWVELTRWLPRAASGDRTWDRLAPSTRVVFEVELTTEDGKLMGLAPRDGSLPAYVRRLLVGIEHLMGRGRFQSAQRAKHAFEISIHLSDTPTRELRIAHTVPNPPAPGRGTFTLPSGRRFDAYVRAITQD